MQTKTVQFEMFSGRNLVPLAVPEPNGKRKSKRVPIGWSEIEPGLEQPQPVAVGVWSYEI